jgi:hypothetical protein
MHDLTGRRFGKLTVLHQVKDTKRNTRWRCACECGQETVAVTGNLMRGRHKSCGCSQFKPRKDRTFMNGYAFVTAPEHPRASKNTGRVREHIIVMERMLGRRLLPLEEVHHKNNIRSDNRPENLELWSRSQPAGARVSDLVEWAREILSMYTTP